MVLIYVGAFCVESDIHATDPNVVHSHPLQSSEPYLEELRDCQLLLKNEKSMHGINTNVKLQRI